MIVQVNTSMKAHEHVTLKPVTLTNAPEDHPQAGETIQPGATIRNLSYLSDADYTLMRIKGMYEPKAEPTDADADAVTSQPAPVQEKPAKKKESGRKRTPKKSSESK